jgi:hypothetical protein
MAAPSRSCTMACALWRHGAPCGHDRRGQCGRSPGRQDPRGVPRIPANPNMRLADIAAIRRWPTPRAPRWWWTTPTARPTCSSRCCWARM